MASRAPKRRADHHQHCLSSFFRAKVPVKNSETAALASSDSPLSSRLVAEEPRPSDATSRGSSNVYNRLVDKALSTGSTITDGEKRVVISGRKPQSVAFLFFISMCKCPFLRPIVLYIDITGNCQKKKKKKD